MSRKANSIIDNLLTTSTENKNRNPKSGMKPAKGLRIKAKNPTRLYRVFVVSI